MLEEGRVENPSQDLGHYKTHLTGSNFLGRFIGQRKKELFKTGGAFGRTKLGIFDTAVMAGGLAAEENPEILGIDLHGTICMLCGGGE